MNFFTRKLVIILALIAVVVGGCAVIVSVGENPTEPVTVTPKATAPVKPTPSAPNPEVKDLRKFELEDRSIGGFNNVWAVWEILNSSSKESNYTWRWEALDASGTRVADGSLLEMNVQPGQRAIGETPTILKTPDVTLRVVDFNRTADW